MYLDLHNHTDHSNIRGFLDSINRVSDLIVYSQKLGHNGIAITDHDTVSNHISAIDCIKELRNGSSKIYKKYSELKPEDWNSDKFKLILGNEIYLCSKRQIEEEKNYKFYHFILLAKDEIGHKQIRELSTRAWINNSFTWVNIRTPTYFEDLFEVIKENPGHIIGMTACLGGQLPTLIWNAYLQNPINPDYNLCYKWIKRMSQCFGEGNFFFEMQPSNQEAQILVNKVLLKFSQEFNIPYVITTDSHYLKKEDRPIHEAFLKSDEDENKDREVGDFYATTYLMSEEEIHSYMDNSLGKENVQKGIDNTKLIRDQIQEYDLDQDLVIPYEPTDLSEVNLILYKKYVDKIPYLKDFFESDYIADKHLVREIINRIEKDYEELGNQKTYDAINTCLKVVLNTSEKTNAHWSAYLLQTRAFIDTIWESGSLCGPSRGCFVPGTQILMGDGTQKNIEDVQIGDKVVTHLGNIKTVKNTFSYDIEEDIYTIKGKGNKEVSCTNNHKFYIKTCEKCENSKYKQTWCKENCKIYEEKRQKCIFKKKQLIKWEEAQNLRVGDMVSYPKIKLPQLTKRVIDLTLYDNNCFYSEDLIWTGRCNNSYQPLSPTSRYIKIDKEFAYLAGVFLGDGWVRNNKNSDPNHKKYEVGFCFNKNSLKEQNSLLRVKRYLEKLGFTVKESHTKNMDVLRVNKTYLHNFFEKEFGHNCYDKKIPQFLFVNDYEIVGALLEGLQNSDGSFDCIEKRISYDSVNYNLISQIKILYGYMGMYGGIAERIPKDNRQYFCHSKKSYKLTYSGKQIYTTGITFLPEVQKIKPGKFMTNYFLEDENNYFFRIESSKKSHYKGKVYDLNVEDDNSFVANGYCVHNSGGGFILLYILGITQINPLKEEVPLYYWRFLHEYRASYVDVDIDCEGSKRDTIIANLQAKYGGYRRVAKVQTILTVKAKNSILISCRGLGIPVEEAQFLSSFIGAERGIQYTLQQTYYGDEENGLVPNTEFVNLMRDKYPQVWEVAQNIEGLVSGVGQHAGGVILSPDDIVNHTALMKASSGDVITQFDLHKLEQTGQLRPVTPNCLSAEL